MAAFPVSVCCGVTSEEEVAEGSVRRPLRDGLRAITPLGGNELDPGV